MALEEYQRKRDFARTPEPAPAAGKGHRRPIFVVQEHHATRLHYDFRLEHAGVLKSWAVPKGPSLDPAEKRLAVRVEDHPVDYGDFEGLIPEGEYGAGAVRLWDRGTWWPDGDVDASLSKGTASFRLEGSKLRGGGRLVRLRARGRGEGKNWLLIKRRDEAARSADWEGVTEERPESVASGRAIDAIAEAPQRDWQSERAT